MPQNSTQEALATLVAHGHDAPVKAARRAIVSALLVEESLADDVLAPLLSDMPAFEVLEAVAALWGRPECGFGARVNRVLATANVAANAVAHLGSAETRKVALHALSLLADDHATAIGNAGGAEGVGAHLVDFARHVDDHLAPAVQVLSALSRQGVVLDRRAVVQVQKDTCRLLSFCVREANQAVGLSVELAIARLRGILAYSCLPDRPPYALKFVVRLLEVTREVASSLHDADADWLASAFLFLRELAPNDAGGAVGAVLSCLWEWPKRAAPQEHALRALCDLACLDSCRTAAAAGAPSLAAALAEGTERARTLQALASLSRLDVDARDRVRAAVADSADAVRALNAAVRAGGAARADALEVLAVLFAVRDQTHADARAALGPGAAADVAAALADAAGHADARRATRALARMPGYRWAWADIEACIPGLVAAMHDDDEAATSDAAVVLGRYAAAIVGADFPRLVAAFAGDAGTRALLAARRAAAWHPHAGVALFGLLEHIAEGDAGADALAAADPAHAWADGNDALLARLRARQSAVRRAAHDARVAAYRARGAVVDAPEGGTCPLTLDTMRDPVVAADGNTYERDAIAAVLAGAKPRSPLTREPLHVGLLVPNNDMRRRIRAHEEAAMAAFDAAPPAKRPCPAPKAFSSA